MTKVSMELPKSALDAATRKHIEGMERTITNLEKKVASRDRAIAALEDEKAKVKRLHEKAKELVDLVASDYDLYEDYGL